MVRSGAVLRTVGACRWTGGALERRRNRCTARQWWAVAIVCAEGLNGALRACGFIAVGRPPSVVRLTMRRSVPFRGRFCSSVDVLRRSLFGFGGIDDWPKRGTEGLCVGIRGFCVRSAVHRFPNAVPRLDRFRFSTAIGAGPQCAGFGGVGSQSLGSRLAVCRFGRLRR